MGYRISRFLHISKLKSTLLKNLGLSRSESFKLYSSRIIATDQMCINVLIILAQ